MKIDPKIAVTLGEEFDDGESGMPSNYTSDMKKVINAYGRLENETYYLFLVENPRSGSTALGYMPRSKQAGFIFVDNHGNNPERLVRTMAHELSHGMFNLKHTFSEYSSLSQGSTTNLLDYGKGTDLLKYQWDYVHDPQTVIPLFEGDEEGESKIFKSYLSFIHYGDSSLRPNRRLFFLKDLETQVTLSAKEFKNEKVKDVKVDWSYGSTTNRGVSSISLNVNGNFFSSGTNVQLSIREHVLLGPDSVITYYFESLDLNPKELIDSVINRIYNIKVSFDSLRAILPTLVTTNMDKTILLGNQNYLSRGLSKYFEPPKTNPSTDFGRVFAMMYNTDVLMNDIDDFEKVAATIAQLK